MNSEKNEPIVLNVAEALQLAIRLHQDGRLEEAEHLYQEVLKGEPNNPSALHYLGIVMIQLGQPEDGVVLIRKALANYPDNPEMRNHLGEAFRVMGRYDEAIQEYKRALELDPKHTETLNNYGVALSNMGNLEEALVLFDRALAYMPRYAEAWNNKGVVNESLGELEEAATCYAEAVKNKGDYKDAIEGFENVIRQLGASSRWRKRLKQEMVETLAEYERLVEENPNLSEPHNNLGALLCERGRFEEGLAHYRKAVMLQPGFVEAINNIGVALHQLERPAEAIPYYLRALELRPDDPQIHCNLGAAYQETLQLDASENELRAAIAKRPDYPEAHYNLALMELATGRFKDGWRDYVWRSSLKDKASAFAFVESPLPMDLSGKRLLVYRNQGIGDEIFFLRFVPELKRRGAWICYRSSAKIQTILNRKGELLDQVVLKRDEEPESIDYRFSIADVPLATAMAGWQDVPPSVSLPVSEHALEVVRKRLAEIGDGPYLGVTWRSGTAYQAQFGNERLPYKALPLEDLANALRGTSKKVIVLQRQVEEGELDRFTKISGHEVHDFSDLNEDLEGMLALLSLIDDYVGVSNTNMHLLAGVGKVGRVLVPTSVLDWRWFTAEASAAWFPGFSIYRQQGDGGWSTALKQLAQDV